MEIQSVTMAGVAVDLMTEDQVLQVVGERLADAQGRPLAIESANLDHFHWFPRGSHADDGGLDWLNLIDGSPLVVEARALTGRRWPRLTGADLLEPLLHLAARDGRSVGFLGGMPEMHDALRTRLAQDLPHLTVAGTWAPSRAELGDPRQARALAETIRESGAELLSVGLGKPRQEDWIREHGAASGARVLLAFGAAPDFYAGHVARAPQVFRTLGVEWVHRLYTQPRRMARRYLVQGPQSAALLARSYRANKAQGVTPRSV